MNFVINVCWFLEIEMTDYVFGRSWIGLYMRTKSPLVLIALEIRGTVSKLPKIGITATPVDICCC